MAITSFDPVTGAPRHSGQAPAATGGAGVAQAPRYTSDSYSMTDVHQTWSMITLRPEYAKAAPERKLEILNNFAAGLQADYGNNPHGLHSLVQNAELRIKGEAEQEEQTFSGDLDTHKLHSIIGRMGMPGATSEKEVKGIVDQQYLEYVQGGGRDHVQHPGILSSLTDTIVGHVMPGAAGGGLVGAGAGSVVPGLGTAAGGVAGLGYGAIAGGAAGGAVRSRGEALKMRYFSNLDAGMDQKEAWSKAKTAANITGGVVGVVSAIDPTKTVGGKLAGGAAGQFAKQQMARAAGTTGATRFGLQVAGRGAVTAGMGAGGEAIDYAQSRAVGNVDDSALMGSLGQRMAISGALGAGIHGTMPVLGKAFKGARVFTGKEYRGKSVGAKWQGVFADETTAGVLGDVANRQSEAEAGVRGQGAPDLDTMKGDQFGYMADIEAATKALDDIWSVLTDGSEPVKFKTVEDADGNLKMVAEGIDAQYSRQANEIEAFVGMFRWDKETGQRVTLLHEGVHAFQNTLPKDVLNGLYKLWEAERVNKAGPLYRDGKPAVEGSRPRLAEEGDISQPKAVRELGDEPTTAPAEGGPQLRTNVHPDVNSPRFETSFREWFAEHMAISNDKWAKGKLETAGKRKKLAGARKEGKATSKQVFDVIADVFRGKMEKVGRILGLSSKGMNTVFRDFLDAGDSYVFGRKDRGHTQQLLTDELTGGPEGTAFLAKAMQRSNSKYPTPEDLKNAAEHVAIAGVEGRKRPKMDIVELDPAEPAPRMSDAELSVARDKVEALKQRSQDKSLSRKERNAAKREVKAIEAKIGEQFLRRETVARRSKFDEERKGEGRDQLEFADDPAGYKDRYEVGGEERAKIAREAREAPDLRKKTLKREARKKAKDDKTVERKGYTEGKGGQLEFDTRSKPKTAQEAVTQKIEDGKDVTSKDLEAMRAEIEAEVSGKLKEKRAAVPRLKGETEDGALGALGREGDDVEHSKRGEGTKPSETLNDQINAAKLPKGPMEAAKSLLEAEGKLDGKTEAGFFGKDWPAVLRKTTLQEGSKKDPGVARAVDRSISDVQEFLRNNPRYIDFYNKDWKLARQHLDDAFDETFGHKLSEDEFLFYRMASGLNSSNTQLKPNIGDALNFLHHWVEEGSLDAFKMGPSAKGNLVIKESPFQVSGTTNGIKVRSMLAVETLIKEFDGDVGKAVDHLQEAIPVRDLHAFNRKMGYKGAVGNIGNIKRVVKQATGQDTLIPRMFIFGQKVGAYTLNAIGDSRYNTIDVWEARFARSYFKGMFKNFGLPENVSEHKVFSRFTELFHKRFEEITGREWENSALQAIRWFYMIDSAKRAGYKHATTNDTISGYTKEKLDQRRGGDEASGGRGDETTRRGDGERGDVEHSRRGGSTRVDEYDIETTPAVDKKLSQSKTDNEALEVIAKESPSAEARTLAEGLLKGTTEAAGLKFTDSIRSQMAGDSAQTWGIYSTSRHSIEVSRAAPSLVGVTLHETAHAKTIRSVNRVIQDSMDRRGLFEDHGGKRARSYSTTGEWLEVISERAGKEASFREAPVSRQELAAAELHWVYNRLRLRDDFKRQKFYGATNLDEMIAEAWSNPTFRGYLKGIKVSELGLENLKGGRHREAGVSKTANLWGRFKQAVADVLGLNIEQATVLGRVMDSSSTVMRSEANAGLGSRKDWRTFGDAYRGPTGREFSRRGSQVYSAELIPGKNTGLVPYLFDAPYAARKAFNDEMRSAFADPVTGRDIIAEEMGLRSRGVAQTDDARPSLYFNSFGDPEINPANRVDFQASKPVVETYAALHGLYSKQEAVAGFRPLYQGAVSDEVSFKIKGEPLSEDGVISLGKILSEELGDSAGDVGLFNRRDGFDLVNFSFGGVSRQQMDGLIPRLRDANVLVDEVKAFGIGEDGFYNENNWRSQPKGEGYHDTIRTQGQDSGGGTGRSDLLGRVDRRIAKPVDQVLERWADRVPSDVEHSRRGGVTPSRTEGKVGKFQGGSGWLMPDGEFLYLGMGEGVHEAGIAKWAKENRKKNPLAKKVHDDLTSYSGLDQAHAAAQRAGLTRVYESGSFKEIYLEGGLNNSQSRAVKSWAADNSYPVLLNTPKSNVTRTLYDPDMDFSKRGERAKPEDGAARQFPERAAQSRGASKDLKPIRERRPDIATHTPQSVKERVDTMAGRSDEALMDSVRELETLTRKGDENFHVVDALELLQRARKAGDDATIETVFEHVSKAGTTIGQLLNQFRQFKGVAARDKVALLNNLLIHKGRRLTDKQQDNFRKLVEADDAAVVRLDAAKEKAFADPTDANIKAAQRAEDAQEVTFQKGQRHAQSMMPRQSFFADWLAVIQGSLLTGVSQMRNLWGNYLQPVVKLPARTVATAVDATYSKLTGKERTVTMTPVAEAASFLRNSWRATKKIPRNFWTGTPGDKIVGETIRGFQPIRSLEQAFTGDLPVDARTGKVRRRDRVYKVMEAVFGAAPEPMLRGLGAFDDLAKAGFGGMRQAEEAKLRGIKKGTREHAELVLGENREVNTAVKETRLEYTFQEDGVVSSAILGVEQKLNQVPYFGPMFKFGLRVLTSPYVKTPVNLAMQTLSYAFPTVALGEGFYHGVQGNRRGASIAAGKFAVATTLGMMAEYMLEDDIITGGPDHSKKLNKMRGDSGMGYFRINMTGLRRKLSGGDGRYQAGDESIRLDFLGLMGGAFAVRAEAKRLEQRERGYLVKSGLTQDLYLDQLTSVTSLGRFAMDQTMLHGMAQGLRALETGNFNRWQASIVNQLAVTNPVWANTFVQYEASKWTYKPSLYDADPGTSLANIIKYRNGEFDDLTVVRDIWGRPVEQTPEGQDPFIYHMLDLRKPQKVTDQARVRLFQIFEATQDGDVIPSWPSPTITLPNREKLTLPAKLYDGYVETVQGAKLQAFQQIVGDQRWYTMPEAEAVKMLKNRMTRYGSQAKNYWVVQNTPALIEEYRKLVAQQKREE